MDARVWRRGCRRAALLEYFGEKLRGECEGCDNCDRRRADKTAAAAGGAAASGGVVRGALTLEQYSEATHQVKRQEQARAR